MLLLAVPVLGSDVTRTIVENENNLTVFLNVSIDNQETFYSIDETYPCQIMNTSGDLTQEMHVKWVVIENASNTSYNYSIRCNHEEYNFSGIYMFEYDTQEKFISGVDYINLSIPANQKIHDADIDENGIISTQEITAYIVSWKTSYEISLHELITAVEIWKSN